MKRFIRTVSLIFAVIMLFSLVSCLKDEKKPDDTTGTQPGSQTDSRTGDKIDTGKELTEAEMSAVIGKIYAGAKDTCPRAANYCGEQKDEIFYEGKLSESEQEMYFGIKPECSLAICSTPRMMPDAFLLALIQPKSDADIDKMISSISDNAHRDWQVCVSAEKVTVTGNGGLVLVIMGSANETEELSKAFSALNIGD